AVALSAETMHIDEYHRGFRELGMGDDEFLARVREAGFGAGDSGTIELFTRGGRRALTPQVENGRVPETLPHQLVQERIVRGVLGWDPSDHRIVYVGGDYGRDFLAAEVEAGRFQVALGMPAVTTEGVAQVKRG